MYAPQPVTHWDADKAHSQEVRQHLENALDWLNLYGRADVQTKTSVKAHTQFRSKSEMIRLDWITSQQRD